MEQTTAFLSFTGLDFLLRFLPAALAIFYISPKGHKNKVLFAESLFFYAMGSGKFMLVLLALTVINASLATLSDSARSRALIIFDLLLFAGIKAVLLWRTDLVMPFGMSFYILKMISYQYDMSHGRFEKKHDFWTVAAYFSAYWHLPQGPVASFSAMNDKKLLPSLKNPLFSERAEDGLSLVIAGLGMKVLLADRLSMMWNHIMRIGIESISTPLAWLGALCFSLLLYYDFWGYSLIAAGIGMLMGYEYIPNFDQPYTAGSIASFYRKWHISLGAFFKNCVYIPLGGSRAGKIRCIFNLVIVWLLTGLWHLGGLNFLLWSTVLCLIIIWEKFAAAPLLKKYPLIGHLHVIVLIPLTWVIFAMPDLSSVAVYYSRLFPFAGRGINVNNADVIKFLGSYCPYLAAGLIGLIPPLSKNAVKYRKSPVIKILAFLIFWICIYEITRSAGNPFMYIDF